MMRVPVISSNGAVSAELVHTSSAIIRHYKTDVLRTRHPCIEKRTAPSTCEDAAVLFGNQKICEERFKVHNGTANNAAKVLGS